MEEFGSGLGSKKWWEKQSKRSPEQDAENEATTVQSSDASSEHGVVHADTADPEQDTASDKIDPAPSSDDPVEIDRLYNEGYAQLDELVRNNFFEFTPAELNHLSDQLYDATTSTELERVIQSIDRAAEPIKNRDPSQPYSPEDLERVRLNLSQWVLDEQLSVRLTPETQEVWNQMNSRIETARSPADFYALDREADEVIERNRRAQHGDHADSDPIAPAMPGEMPRSNLYINRNTREQAYWADGKAQPFDDTAKAEQKWQEDHPDEPPHAPYPKFGEVILVNSSDEIPVIQAEIEAEEEAERAAQAVAGAAALAPGHAPLTGPPGGTPTAGPRDLKEGRLGWEGRYFVESGNRWERLDIGRYGDVPILSMDQIKNNELHQKLMGDLMVAMDYTRSGIFDRMQNSATLSPDDQKFVTHAQYELSRIVHEFSPLERSFTDNKVREILVTDPDLMRMMDDTGLAANGKAVREFMMHLAVRHQGGADDFLDAYDKWTDEASVHEALVAEEEVQAICDEIGILRENYERFVVPGDIEATHANLTSHFAQNAQAWERWVDQLEAAGYLHLTGSPSDVAAHFAERAMTASPDRVDPSIQETWILGDVHQAKLQMGRFFKMALAPEFKEDMQRYALNKGPQTEAEAREQAAAQLEPQVLQRLFNIDREVLAKARGFSSWNEASPEAREEIRDQWSPPEVRENLKNRNRSWFSRMMRAIARSLLSEKKKGLSLENS